MEPADIPSSTPDKSVEMVDFDMFLNFKTKELTNDFISFKLQNRNRQLSMFVFVAAIFILLTRGVVFSDVKALVQGNPVFYIYNTYIQSMLFLFTAIAACIHFAPRQFGFMKNWNPISKNWGKAWSGFRLLLANP